MSSSGIWSGSMQTKTRPPATPTRNCGSATRSRSRQAKPRPDGAAASWPFELVGPGVIRTAHHRAGLADALEDRRCPVPADVRHRPQLAVVAADDEDRLAADIDRDVLAGAGQLGDVTGEDPRPLEDLDQLLLEQLGIGIGDARQAPGRRRRLLGRPRHRGVSRGRDVRARADGIHRRLLTDRSINPTVSGARCGTSRVAVAGDHLSVDHRGVRRGQEPRTSAICDGFTNGDRLALDVLTADETSGGTPRWTAWRPR